jgi:hypothetical protein
MDVHSQKKKRPKLSLAKQRKLDEASAEFRDSFMALWDELARVRWFPKTNPRIYVVLILE